jgi:hypothetical protein
MRSGDTRCGGDNKGLAGCKKLYRASIELFTITKRARVHPTLDQGVVPEQRRGPRLLLGKPLAADVMSPNALSKGTSKCHSPARPATPMDCALNKVTTGHRGHLYDV